MTPSSRRKPAATPSRSARATRSAKKPPQSPVEDEDEPEFEEEEEEDDDDDDDDDMDLDEPSPEPAPRTITRTRSKRSIAKPRSRKAAAAEPKEKSPSPEYQDGLDDLVTMQLQQDLYHDPPEAHETADVSEPLPEYAENFQALCQTGLGDEMRILSTILLEKLSGKRQIPVRGLEPEYQKVHQLIEQTVSMGEGNSMLLLGSRGCGKTAIVESIISSLRKEHSNDFHVVRLNGFLHTDDRLALREMWRQLGREMNTEDDAAKVSSYADTMATLLALLSHPEELFGASGDPGSKTAAKSIVILLDEFDLFVTHPRQTLLYNLFDIAQARKAPIAVIGLTTKVDVTEMLEKRVKSRFSHRYTYVPLPRSFETFSDICFGSLDLSDAEIVDIADELGSERTLVESGKWNTLLGGWKEYLKVRSILFPFIQSIESLLTLALENSICGTTKNSNSISSVSTTKPNQQRSSSTAHLSPSATCYKVYRRLTHPYPKFQPRKPSLPNPSIALTQHLSPSPHPSHHPVPHHCHWLCW